LDHPAIDDLTKEVAAALVPRRASCAASAAPFFSTRELTGAATSSVRNENRLDNARRQKTAGAREDERRYTAVLLIITMKTCGVE
jgi:hypothetical protein